MDLAILRVSLEYVLGLVYYRLCILCQIIDTLETMVDNLVTALFHQSPPHGITHQLGTVSYAKFVEYTATMILRRLDGDR